MSTREFWSLEDRSFTRKCVLVGMIGMPGMIEIETGAETLELVILVLVVTTTKWENLPTSRVKRQTSVIEGE